MYLVFVILLTLCAPINFTYLFIYEGQLLPECWLRQKETSPRRVATKLRTKSTTTTKHAKCTGYV